MASSVTRKADFMIFTVEGEFSIFSIAEDFQIFSNALAEVPENILVDLSQVREMDTRSCPDKTDTFIFMLLFAHIP
ncbi:hypothetical protein, partial [Thalassolituus sp. UBA2009]|uniref:hypothetical protein n=1 Tax=Thalassolituus sp. UBA2009 TaxID=1947658 RepID=UPI00257E29B0